MLAYILKRILLMVPTLFGALTITFAVIQFVPGGPVEQYLSEAKGFGGLESGGSSYRGNQGVDPKRLEQIKALGISLAIDDRSTDPSPHPRRCRLLGVRPAVAEIGRATPHRAR